MKIVVIGGTGLIGTKVVAMLRESGHDGVAASPASGVNTYTGEGLTAALASADVVLDLANAPSFEDRAVMEFFETAGRNILAAEKTSGVRHHLALSVVGAERLPASGYLRAKLAQERLIKESGIPYTIVRSTQFFEFVKGIVDAAASGGVVRLSPALFQPIAADDIAAAVADYALGKPLNTVVEVAGPEPLPMDKAASRFMAATGDTRRVVADIHARYFGTELDDKSLTPGHQPRLGRERFEEWLNRSTTQN